MKLSERLRQELQMHDLDQHTAEQCAKRVEALEARLLAIVTESNEDLYRAGAVDPLVFRYPTARALHKAYVDTLNKILNAVAGEV